MVTIGYHFVYYGYHWLVTIVTLDKKVFSDTGGLILMVDIIII